MFSFDLGEQRSLRPFELRDARELHALIEQERTMLSRWMPWAATQTPEQTQAFLRMSRRQLAEDDGFQAAILQRGRIVGSVGFHRVLWASESTSIGYWLAGSAQGRGTMTLAVAALADWAFRGWELNRVSIAVAVPNTRSRAIPERLGFRLEGTLRQAEFVAGRYLDHALYAMLAGDWSEQFRP